MNNGQKMGIFDILKGLLGIFEKKNTFEFSI